MKITDQLYECYREAAEKGNCDAAFAPVRRRFVSIVEELGLEGFDIAGILDEVERQIVENKSSDFTASRGEYLNARIIAAFLGWEFVDAQEIVFFNERGQFDEKRSYRLIAERLKHCAHAVIPGFYGMDAWGCVKTFTRGGSDISGSIVARGLNAELYENWTDVSEIGRAHV